MIRRLLTAALPIVLSVSTLTMGAQEPAAGTDAAIRFLEPTGRTLSGTTNLAVDAPEDTTAVRFYLDDVQLSEITNLYARQTKTSPQWSTATDVGWFPSGEHALRAVADTPSGPVVATKSVITRAERVPPGTVSLNGGWKFSPAKDLPQGDADGTRPPAAQPDYDTTGWANIVVPDSFGAVRDEWNDDAGMQVVYRRGLHLDQPDPGERTSLVFDSCFWSCRYFVNGTEVGTSTGGYLPTRLDVTDAVSTGINTLAVVVDNRTSTMGGYARPVQGLYWNYGGILQQVRLERTPAVALVETRAEGTLDGDLTLRPTGVNGTATQQPVDAMLTVEDPDGNIVLGPRQVSTSVPAGGGATTPIRVQVPHPRSWDLKHPNLYTVRLRPLDDAAWHELVERTGFRDITVKGLDLLLNGKPVQDLQGFNRHADYPGLGRTQPDGLADREIKALHDKGFRLFRPAHYPTTPAELDAADKYGMLVIEEINNISSQPGSFLARPDVQEFGRRTLARMVARDRSHPSLFAWSVGNENATETDGAVDYVRTVIGYGRTIDPTRLYTQVSHRHTRDRAYPYEDFFATNYYAGWYSSMDSLESHLDAVQKMAKMPILLSEYGAEAVYQRPGLGRGTEYYQAKVVDEHNRLLNHRPHMIGKMYWTSTEFWCTPTWGSGQNPEPVPPFHTKGLQTYFRDHKLGWRVMFSPVRITRATVLEAPLDQPTTVHERITVQDTSGEGTSGLVRVEAPDGFTAEPVPFTIEPGGSTTLDVPLTGTLTREALQSRGFVRAVVDADTEALPVPFTIRPLDSTVSPASDDFASSQLDEQWRVVRPDDSGWSLTDRPGSLRLSTLPGSETGGSTDGPNLFVRENTPTSDWTAEATVTAPDLSADFQQVGLYAYVDDDDYVKVDLGWIDGRRAIEIVAESGGRVVQRASVPYHADSAHLRLVRRGDSIHAEYSTDGRDWFAAGSGSLAGTPRLALQAVGGGEAPPTVPTYVDDLQVRTSGAMTADGVRLARSPLFIGRGGTAYVRVSNGSDTPHRVTATLDVPQGWSTAPGTATVPAFGTADVPVSVTPTGHPTTAPVTATVQSEDAEVYGAPQTEALTAPYGDDVALALDAGPSSSPVLDSYHQLTPDQAWDGSTGYGWYGATPQSRDRGGPDDLRRDIVTDREPASLRVAVPAGTHQVDLLVGDHSFASDPMTVTSEGRTLVSIDSAVPVGQFRWFRFSLDGGTSGRVWQLDFAAQQPGQYWRFAALTLE